MKTKISILALTKAFFILLVMCCFSSCSITPVKLEKPFIIINKEVGVTGKGKMYYQFQDKNGQVNNFFDEDKYNIGDTIK
jgi:hypothetical protein